MKLKTFVLESLAMNFRRLDRDKLRCLPTSLKNSIVNYFVKRGSGTLSDDHLRALLDANFLSVNFRNESTMRDSTLKLVSSRCPQLHSVNLKGCTELTDHCLRLLFERCPLVSELNLCKTKNVLSLRCAKMLVCRMRALHSLELDEALVADGDKCVPLLLRGVGGFLRRFSVAKTTASDRWLEAVADNCSDLRDLNCSECMALSARGVGRVLFACRQLERLSIANLRLSAFELRVLVAALPDTVRELDLSMLPVNEDVLSVVARRCPSLRRLDMRAVFNYGGGGLAALASSCTQLRTLNIDVCKDIECVSFMPFESSAANTPRFRYLGALSLRGLKHVDDRALQAIARACPELRDLNLSGLREIGDASLDCLASLASDDDDGIGMCLETLDLSLCRRPSDASIARLVRAHGATLRKLALHASRAGPVTLRAIGECCSARLESLSVYGIGGVPDASVRYAVRRLPRLRHLDVSGARNLSTTTFRVIAAHCAELRSLYAIGCARVTDEGISAVAESCLSLQHLNVNAMVLISDLTFCVVARRCRALTHLSAAGCDRITDAGFLMVGRGCPLLNRMMISANSPVSSRAIQILAHDRPNLKTTFN
jgi:hypothetical protein